MIGAEQRHRRGGIGGLELGSVVELESSSYVRIKKLRPAYSEVGGITMRVTSPRSPALPHVVDGDTQLSVAVAVSLAEEEFVTVAKVVGAP